MRRGIENKKKPRSNQPNECLLIVVIVSSIGCLVVVVGLAGSVLVDGWEAVLGDELFLLRLSVGVEGWALSLAADADSVAAVRSESISSGMGLLSVSARFKYNNFWGYLEAYSSAVIPEGDIVLAPLEASVQLLRSCDNLVEVGNDGIALSLGDSDNLGDETRVEEETVPSGDRVGADEWVFGGDGITTNRSAKGTRSISLHVGRVEGGQTLEVVLHRRRQGVVSSVLGRPQSVTTTSTGRASQNLKGGVRRRLNFVGHLFILC